MKKNINLAWIKDKKSEDRSLLHNSGSFGLA